MRNTLKFGLLAALATFSLVCTKATVEPTVGGDEKVQMTFTATSGAVTKTYLYGKISLLTSSTSNTAYL